MRSNLIFSRSFGSTSLRSTSLALTSLGLLVLGCGDDSTPGTTASSSSTSDASTTDDLDSTTSSPESTDGTSDSGSSDTAAVDSTGTTGPGIECGNDVIEDGEACDGTELGEESCETQGFDGGELTCMADCSGYDTRGCLMAVCGDGIAVGKELCDGRDNAGATCESEGFDSGELLCLEDCASFDTGGCGVCGNNQVDGAEACDGVWLQGQDCFTQGFDSGTIGCAADCATYDTSGCGLCGNDVTDGEEVCDGVDLNMTTCNSLGFTAAGEPLCNPGCANFDVYGCGVVQYDVSATTVNGTQSGRFRGNGYVADGNGVLVDFEVYLGLAAACDVDFYVFESALPDGPLTQIARSTANVGPGIDYYAAGIPLVPVTAGMYYALGAAWNCSATYYWNSSGAYLGIDGGVGLTSNSRWDNGYPGPSDMYTPPGIGTNTFYVQRVFFGD